MRISTIAICCRRLRRLGYDDIQILMITVSCVSAAALFVPPVEGSSAAGASSSQEGLPRELSSSRASSRGEFASPAGPRRHSWSQLQSPSRCTDEDRQEEQSSLDFVVVVATLRSQNELSEAPSGSRKICGFCAALEDDDQSASLCHLPVGSALGDIFSAIDDRVLSPSGMRLKKVSKLFPYPGIHRHCFNWFEGEEATKAHSLNSHMTELARMRSCDNFNRTDMILSSSEGEDMEAAMWDGEGGRERWMSGERERGRGTS